MGRRHSQWCVNSIIAVLIASILSSVTSTDYNECIGTSSECCVKRELFGGDRAILKTESGYNDGHWCDQVFIVRQTEQQYDECKGCTFTIEFEEEGFSGSVELREANYTTASYFGSETLYLNHLAEYDYPNGDRFPSDNLRTTATVVKFIYSSRSIERGSLKVIITPNIPASTVTVTIILSISLPLIVLFIVFNIVLFKLRQRRTAQIRSVMNSRINAMILDAQQDAVDLREARQRARHPQSPDPTDSVAPPSYAEATPPPQYEDVVNEGTGTSFPPAPSYTPAANTTLEDPAGPDTGRDDDLLVV